MIVSFQRTLVFASALTSCTTFLIGCAEDGKPTDRNSKAQIVGGKVVAATVDDERIQSTVALTTDHQSPSSRSGRTLLDSGKSFCTATIISESALLTAAHCLADFDRDSLQKNGKLILPNSRDFVASFGTHVNKREYTIRAKAVIPHPDWTPHLTLSADPERAPRDIGIVILEQPIPAGYAPVKVATEEADLPENQIVHLLGYGVTWSRRNNNTGVLREVQVPIKKVNRKSETLIVNSWFRGACAGDSGGPMYMRDNAGAWTIVGITSAGVEIFQTCIGLNNLFTDVRSNRNWIRKTLGDFGQDLI